MKIVSLLSLLLSTTVAVQADEDVFMQPPFEGSPIGPSPAPYMYDGFSLHAAPPKYNTDYPRPPDEKPPPNYWNPQPPFALPVRGNICEDAVSIAAPEVGGTPAIVAGLLTKSYWFPQCYHYVDQQAAATVYKVTGTGEVFDASTLQGPDNRAYVTVYSGCTDSYVAAYNNNGYYDEYGQWIPGVHPKTLPPQEENRNGNNNNNNNFSSINNEGAGNRHLEEEEDADEQQEGGNDRPDYPYNDDYDERNPGNYNPNICVEGHTYDNVRWLTEAGEEYTIIVHGEYYTRDFVLQVSAYDSTAVCSDAVSTYLGTLTVNETPFTTLGSTRDGLYFTGLPNCYFDASPPTIVYEVTVAEPNVRVMADIQGNARVSVFFGGCDVGGWTCNAGREPQYNNGDKEEDNANSNRRLEDYGPGQDGESISRESNQRISWHNEESGTTYLIAVNTCCGTQSTGDYLLSLNVTEYGNVCRDAKEVSLDFTEVTSLEEQKVYRNFNSCLYGNYNNNNRVSGQMALYTFEGTSENILVDVKQPRQYYSARISLFAGDSCDGPLNCVANDNWNNRLIALTRIGQRYYAAVYLEYATSGPFTVSLQTITYGNICNNAVNLGSIGLESVQLTNSTAGASIYQDLYSCNYGNVDHPARIYSFTAAESGIMTSSLMPTSGGESRYEYFDKQISIFEGSCFRPGCVRSEDWYFDETRQMVWDVVEGATYFVVISESAESSGQTTDSESFELKLEMAEVGDACDDAITIENVTRRGL